MYKNVGSSSMSINISPKPHFTLGHGFDYFFGLPYTLVDTWVHDAFFSWRNIDLKEFLMPLLLLLPLSLVLKKQTFLCLFLLSAFMLWFMLEHWGLHKVFCSFYLLYICTRYVSSH